MGDVFGTANGHDVDLDAALTGAVAGDGDGFAALWRALQPSVLRYLRVVVGAAAEDVASETWLQAARDLPTFVGDAGAFRVWLFRIARNRGMDEVRRAGRRREDAREPSDQALGGEPVPDVASDVLERSGTDWALGLIATLPPDQAEAVMLRVVAGLGVAQVAEVLGKRPGAVRIASMRGLRRLALHPEIRARATGDRNPGPGNSFEKQQLHEHESDNRLGDGPYHHEQVHEPRRSEDQGEV